MAHRDPTRPIRTAGIGESPEGVHEEVVCYTVVSGRGRGLVRHLKDDKSKRFARRLVACHVGMETIIQMIRTFEQIEWTDKLDRRRARKDLVHNIRTVATRSLA